MSTRRAAVRRSQTSASLQPEVAAAYSALNTAVWPSSGLCCNGPLCAGQARLLVALPTANSVEPARLTRTLCLYLILPSRATRHACANSLEAAQQHCHFPSPQHDLLHGNTSASCLACALSATALHLPGQSARPSPPGCAKSPTSAGCERTALRRESAEQAAQALRCTPQTGTCLEELHGVAPGMRTAQRGAQAAQRGRAQEGRLQRCRAARGRRGPHDRQGGPHRHTPQAPHRPQRHESHPAQHARLLWEVARGRGLPSRRAQPQPPT